MHGAPFGKVTGQRAPGAAGTQEVERGAEYLVQFYSARGGLFAGALQSRTDRIELFSGDVAGGGLSHACSLSFPCGFSFFLENLNRP